MNDFLNKHKKLAIGLAVVLAGLISYGMSWIQANMDDFMNTEKEPINQTYTVEYGNIESTVSGKGYIQAGKEIKIVAPVGVTVKEVLVQRGDSVSAGQSLAEIEPASIAGKLAEAVQTETELQNQLNRNDLTTYEREALTGQRTEVRSYISQLRDLRDYPVITAPQNGIITSVYAIDGEPVTVQNTLQSGGQSSGNQNSSSNSPVSLFTPKITVGTSENIPVFINPLKIIRLGYVLNSQLPLLLGSHWFSSIQNTVPIISGNLSDKVNGTPGFIKVSETPEESGTNSTDNSDILFKNEDVYVNGRSDFVPDTQSSNINPNLLKEENPSSSSGSTMSPNSSSTGSESGSSNSERTPSGQSTGNSQSVAGQPSAQGANSSSGSVKRVSDFTTYDAVVFKMGSMDELRVNIMIDERDILALQPGQEARVELDALPGEVLTGNISSISNNAQTSEGSSKYSVDISLNTDKNLKSGMTANVTIITGSNQNVLMIPIEALQDEGSRRFVYTSESSDGILGGEVDVTTGLSNNDYVEITGGLAAGQVIYYPKPDTTENLFGVEGSASSEGSTENVNNSTTSQ